MAKKDLFLKQLASALAHASMRHSKSVAGEYRGFDTEEVFDRLGVRELMDTPIENLSDEDKGRAKVVLLLCTIEQGDQWHDEIATSLRRAIRRVGEQDAVRQQTDAEAA